MRAGVFFVPAKARGLRLAAAHLVAAHRHRVDGAEQRCGRQRRGRRQLGAAILADEHGLEAALATPIARNDDDEDALLQGGAIDDDILILAQPLK